MVGSVGGVRRLFLLSAMALGLFASVRPRVFSVVTLLPISLDVPSDGKLLNYSRLRINHSHIELAALRFNAQVDNVVRLLLFSQ